MNYLHYFKNFLQHKKNRSFLGVDVGQTAIHFFELAKTKQNYEIVNFSSAEMPMVMEKENNEAILVKTIKETLQKTGIKTRSAATALSNASVISKVIALDKSLTLNDIDRHIALESEKYFGSRADILCWDFAVLGQTATDDRKIDVHLIAAKKFVVQQRVKLLQQAGLQIKSMDVEMFALARLASLQKLENVTLLHLQDHRLLLGIVKQQHLIFSDEIFLNWQNQQPKSVAVAIEHQLSLAGQYHPPEIILLSGNYSDIHEIADYLREQSWQPLMANPFVSMSCAKTPEQFPSFALSCGLALWNFA